MPYFDGAKILRAMVDAVQPDILLEDGQRPEVPGWDLSAIWTPGHSPGHLCFWEPKHQLMLSGDHVLPTITPHIRLRAFRAAAMERRTRTMVPSERT